MSMSGLFELHYAEIAAETRSSGCLFFKLLLPQPRQRIKLGAPIVFTRLPLSESIRDVRVCAVPGRENRRDSQNMLEICFRR